MNIYEKLQRARELVKRQELKKDGKNAFAKYDYFTPSMVNGIVSSVCGETQLLPIINLKQDALGYLVTLELVDIDSPEHVINFEMRTDIPSIKATNLTQQMGGMFTYASRYICMSVFEIVDNSLDFDAHDNKETNMSKAIDYIKKSKNEELDAIQERIILSDKYTDDEKEELVAIITKRLA